MLFRSQDIESISIDVQNGIVNAGILFFKETAMPAKPPQHPDPYTDISNKSFVDKQIDIADIQGELDALIDKIDSLV